VLPEDAPDAGASLWAVLQPIALTAAFVFLFRRVANIDVGIPYASFVFPGMLTWALFSTAITNSTTAMLNSMSVAAKASYPRIVAPFSAVLLPLVDLCAGLLLLPILLVLQRPGAHLSPVRFLGALGGCILLAAGIGTFLSALTVFIRDIRNVVPLVLQLGVLVTPVGYPGSRLPGWLSFSPIATYVEGFRSSVVRAPAPSLTRWLVAYTITAVVLAGGVAYFQRVERRFPDVA
jgi:lipopolysaccharide transport system permease protein